MYAVIKTGGKQYKVEQGDVIYVEKLDGEVDATVDFEVIAMNDGTNFVTGTPFVKDAKVIAKVLKTAKAKKITVFTYKPKKGEKRKMGHRQPYTKLQIESIVTDGVAPKAAKAAKAKAEDKAEEKTEEAAPKAPKAAPKAKTAKAADGEEAPKAKKAPTKKADGEKAPAKPKTTKAKAEVKEEVKE